MPKNIFIISLYFLIEIIYCAENCYSKQLFNYKINDNKIEGFEHGYKRTVWHHADSCNSYLVDSYAITGTGDSVISCCYIHIEYRSLIDGERYDQYGCIDVLNPWEDYDGGIDNVTNRANDIKDKLKEYKEDGIYVVDSEKNLHVKILCSANFLKLSLLSLLILILF